MCNSLDVTFLVIKFIGWQLWNAKRNKISNKPRACFKTDLAIDTCTRFGNYFEIKNYCP